MTIGGALSELNNLLNADDIPCYYKPSIKAVMDTIALSSSEKPNNSTTETLVSLGAYKQVVWERDTAIEQLHELGYEFGQKIESTTKNDSGVDAISRQEAIDTIRQLYLDLASQKAVIDILKVLPSVTPIRPKGHWIPRNSFLLQYKCSECSCESEKYNFCPNCGADMREV